MKRFGVLTDYLQAVVLLANEVSDFERHCVHLFDRKLEVFGTQWHFLRGYKCERVDDESKQRQAFLRGVLFNGQPVCGGLRSAVEEPASLDPGSVMVPLYLHDRPVGLLTLWPPEGKHLGEYDAYLAGCIAKVAATGFRPGDGRNALIPLQFMVLHRRHFLTATPTLSEVVRAYLEKVVLSEGVRAYLENVVGDDRYTLFSKDTNVSANFRTAHHGGTDGSALTLRFSDFVGDVSDASKRRAREHRLTLSKADKNAWLHSWAESEGKAPPDVDAEYRDLIRGTRSHVAVPCLYGEDLYGVLSVDSRMSEAFDTLAVRALCVLGAQMAPIFANAQARSTLVKERTYLEKVIDAIPDELLIVDKEGRILKMNSAKRQRFPDAREGQFCYEQFERGKSSPCTACYTLRSIDTGESVQQALWKYGAPGTEGPSYVEISAGRIDIDEEEPQGVEIVRYVTQRESMLRWMADTLNILSQVYQERLSKHVRSPQEIADHLWEHVGLGLKAMGFSRYRVYGYNSPCFVGKFCFPADSFKGEDFRRFHLDPAEDVPSRVTLQDGKLRPVRFVVDTSQRETFYIPPEEVEWNYQTCCLNEVPPACAKYLGKDKIRSWVDIPIGTGCKVYGKVSVDKGVPIGSGSTQPETAYEMSLLASFGRYASLSMYAAEEYVSLVAAQRKKAALEFAGHIAHEFNNCKLALHVTIEYLKSRLPLYLKVSESELGSSGGPGFGRLSQEIHDHLFDAVLLPSVAPSTDERDLADKIVAIGQKHRLKCSWDDAMLFVVSGLDKKFLRLIDSAQTTEDAMVLQRLTNLANLLSKLQKLAETEKTLSGIETGLLLNSVLDQTMRTPVDLGESIAASIRIVASCVPSSTNIRLEKPIPHLPKIPSYAESLRLVWINLIRNAVEAMAGRGTVTVDVTQKANRVAVRIADEGGGLPARIRSSILRGMPQGSGSPHPSRGLEIVEAIVEAHRGTLRIVSSSTKGTIVEVSIPTRGVET